MSISHRRLERVSSIVASTNHQSGGGPITIYSIHHNHNPLVPPSETFLSAPFWVGRLYFWLRADCGGGGGAKGVAPVKVVFTEINFFCGSFSFSMWKVFFTPSNWWVPRLPDAVWTGGRVPALIQLYLWATPGKSAGLGVSSIARGRGAAHMI